MLAPCVLIVGLGLSGGGFDVVDRHIAGLGAWLVVVALIVFGAGLAARRRAGPSTGRPGCWDLSWSGRHFRPLWSGSVELSVIEADRVLVYLGFFLAAFLLAQTTERRQRFAEGIAIGFAICRPRQARQPPPAARDRGLRIARQRRPPALSARLLERQRDDVRDHRRAAALDEPQRRAGRALRWLSVAAIPAVLLTLYFTYSRGGLLTLVVAAGCLLALSADRLWLLATLAIGAARRDFPRCSPSRPATSLADNTRNQASVDQGVTRAADPARRDRTRTRALRRRCDGSSGAAGRGPTAPSRSPATRSLLQADRR